MMKDKKIGLVAFVIGILILLVIIIFILGIGKFIFKEFKSDKEHVEITNKAYDYFINKYNVKKKDIEFVDNNFYGEHEDCMISCYENQTNVFYNGKECLIEYHLEGDYYSDDCQLEEIKNDFNVYLKKKFIYLTEIEVSVEDSTPIKFDNSIDDYFNKVNKFNADKDVTGNYGISTKIWVKANDDSEAKSIYQENVKELVMYLEKLGLNYWLTISKTNTDYEARSFYYIESYEDKIKLVDNVDNNHVEGLKRDYKNGSFIK